MQDALVSIIDPMSAKDMKREFGIMQKMHRLYEWIVRDTGEQKSVHHFMSEGPLDKLDFVLMTVPK